MFRSVAALLVVVLALLLAGCGGAAPEERLARAERELDTGHPGAAVIELKNALQQAPDLAPARARLGDAHLLLGDYASAAREFGRARELGLETDPVRLGLLRSKVRSGRHTEVIDELAGARTLSPAFAVVLGEAYLVSGAEDQAEPWLHKGAGLADGALGLSRVAVRRGDLETALELAAKAVEIDPANTEAWLHRGELEVANQQADRALESFRAAAATPAGALSGRFGSARAMLRMDDLEGASAAVAGVLELAPGYATAHYLSGYIHYRQGDLEAAERSILEAQRLEPDHVQSLYLLALIKQGLGQIDEAQAFARRFVDREPAHAAGLKLLGSMLFQARRFEDVVGLLEPVVHQTDDARLLAMLGAAHFQLGDTTAAAASFARAVELEPHVPAFHARLALCLLAGAAAAGTHEPQERAALEGLLAQHPDDESTLLAVAGAAARDGDLQASIGYVERAARANARAVRPRIVLARVYRALNRIDHANLLVNQALTITPADTELLVLQAELGIVRGDRAATVTAVAGLQDQLTSQTGAVDPDADLLGTVGTLQLGLGQLGPARANLERALQLGVRPNLPVLHSLTRLEIAEDAPEGARARIEELNRQGAAGREHELLRADVLRAQGRTVEANRAYAALINRGVRDAVFRLTEAQMAAGDTAAAVRVLVDWLEQRPDDAAVRFLLADAYLRVEPVQAVAHYERLVDSGNTVVLNNLAWLYMEAGDGRALDLAQRAAAAAPNDPDILDTVGWVMTRQGLADQGLPHLRRSIELRSDNPTSLYHLAIALRDTGATVEARRLLERALESGEFPEAADARIALSVLADRRG